MYSGDWWWCRQDVHHHHDICLFNSSFCCGWRWWLCRASPCESFFYTNCTSDWQSYPFQLTAFILAVPAHVCVYKCIQKFDTVRIIAGPFTNMIGTVVHIYHEIGWYTIKTSTCHLWIYWMDMELDVLEYIDTMHTIPFLSFHILYLRLHKHSHASHLLARYIRTSFPSVFIIFDWG